MEKLFSKSNILVMNSVRKLMNKGYIIAPITKDDKIPAMKDFKHYTYERASNYIKNNYFENKDIAIVLNRNICCLDIDDNGLTPSKYIYEKICEKIKGFVNYPTEKTKHGYHIYFSCNDEKLKRNLKFMNSNFLNIPFDKTKYDMMSEDEKKKVMYMNGIYKLSVDFLIGYHNGTNAYVRTAPSTNIKTINELPYITELKHLPEEIKKELELVTEKTLTTIKNIKTNNNYIPTQYTKQQIDKVKKYIKYLDQNRFNNMTDFYKVTSCIHNISETLIDEWLEKCKLSILWNEETWYDWCINFFHNSSYKSIGYGSFCHFLKIDNPKMYDEFIE